MFFLRIQFFFLLTLWSSILLAQEELSKLEVVFRKPVDKRMNEISGLEKWRGYFLGFNDSGGEPEVYVFDGDIGHIVQTIRIANAKNYDWEDIAIDDKYIYIGDFGNNYGNRRNLTIYKFPHQGIPSPKETNNVSVKAKKLKFSYPEQIDFSENPHYHDFDAESLVSYRGKLHLFAKEWKSKNTKHYVLNTHKRKQKAKLLEKYALTYLATGADIWEDEEGNAVLSLLGYTQEEEAFITQFRLSKDQNTDGMCRFLNQGLNQKFYLGHGKEVGQVEGLTYDEEGNLWISAEAYKGFDPPLPQAIMLIRQ